MLEHEYDTMRAVEDDYWWYRVLRAMTCREVVRATAGRSEARVLDAGCGTGGTMAALRTVDPALRLSGIDVSPLALAHVRERGFGDAREASVEQLPCAESSQDAVVSLDVLYHEGVDEERAMREFLRVLKPGGTLIMNLPAFECLRGRHDEAVRGVRRYTAAGVRDLHARNGFQAERVFCWNAWLFLPVLIWRRASRRLSAAQTGEAVSDLAMPPAWLNAAAALVASADAAACRAIRSPIGTSVFSVAKAVKTP